MQQMLKCAIIQQTFAACNSFLIITDQQGITRERKRESCLREHSRQQIVALCSSHMNEDALPSWSSACFLSFSFFHIFLSIQMAFKHFFYFFHCVRMIMRFNSPSTIVGQLQFLIKLLFCNGTHKVAANNVKICINEQ